jgi:hypothetical protein
VELRPGLCLSHDPALRVHVSGARVLLGRAVQTASGRGDPRTELAAPDIDVAARDWAGRWLLLEGDTVSLDAGGLLACFLRRIDDAVWASSSPELLRALVPALDRPRTRIAPEIGMDWLPPPGSGIAGIGRLLPTQRLRLTDGTITARPLPHPDTGASPDALLASLQSRLVNAVSGFAPPGADVRLPLSAGRDSRLVLAAAVKAGASVRAYSFDRPGLSRADRLLPPQLAATAGLEYELIPFGPPDPRRVDLWDLHTAGHAMTADRDDFARGQHDRLSDADAELSGNVFEVGRAYYHGVLPPDPGATPEETATAVLRELPSGHAGAVLEWARWMHATPAAGWDWRDRFYLEQRVGGWLGAICQGVDLAAVPRVHIANCAAYIAETMSLDEATRRASAHHLQLIEAMAPELGALPFNARDSLGERVRHRARREAKELRSQRTPWAYAAQRTRRLLRRRQ